MPYMKLNSGNSLVVQWLGLCACLLHWQLDPLPASHQESHIYF